MVGPDFDTDLTHVILHRCSCMFVIKRIQRRLEVNEI